MSCWPGEDGDSLGAKVISMRRVTLTNRDYVERLRLSGRSKTSGRHLSD